MTESGTNSPYRRVVCAACLDGNGRMVVGPRHWDSVMHDQNKAVGINPHTAEQGFIDQRGAFLTRREAFEVATAAGQIRQKSGNPNSKELFSEDLY